MTRVGALVATSQRASILSDIDAVRAFDVIVRQRASDPATSNGLQSPPCGFRALFNQGHTACDPALRKCKKCPRAAPYARAIEGPIIDLVKPLLAQGVAGKVVPQ